MVDLTQVWSQALPQFWDPLRVAQSLLRLCQTEVEVEGRQHLPPGPGVVVSNHRSFLDAPVLMAAAGRTVHWASHYYLSQAPGLREVAASLGCIPLKQGSRSQIQFFRTAEGYLAQGSTVGLFPEGAQRIARVSSPLEVGPFQPGFAHLALRSRIRPLPIVPVAILVTEEWQPPDVPLSVLRWFDPTEPMFQAEGGHPVVIYRRLSVRILPPVWMPMDPVPRGAVPELAQTIAADIQAQIASALRD